jgi:hypothetical protein
MTSHALVMPCLPCNFLRIRGCGSSALGRTQRPPFDAAHETMSAAALAAKKYASQPDPRPTRALSRHLCRHLPLLRPSGSKLRADSPSCPSYPASSRDAVRSVCNRAHPHPHAHVLLSRWLTLPPLASPPRAPSLPHVSTPALCPLHHRLRDVKQQGQRMLQVR